MSIENISNLINVISNEFKENKKLIKLKELINSYNGTDYKEYVNDDCDSYYRNKVYSNDMFEIYIITWKGNKESKIHDHPENGCILHVLEGELKEEIYNSDLEHIKTNIAITKSTSYIEGNKILHKIINNTNQNTVTLHIYSPPNHKIKCY